MNICQDPLIFPIFLRGVFGKCIGGSDTSAICDRSWTSWLEFPEFVADMKLMFIYFVPLTYVVLLLCFIPPFGAI